MQEQKLDASEKIHLFCWHISCLPESPAPYMLQDLNSPWLWKCLDHSVSYQNITKQLHLLPSPQRRSQQPTCRHRCCRRSGHCEWTCTAQATKRHLIHWVSGSHWTQQDLWGAVPNRHHLCVQATITGISHLSHCYPRAFALCNIFMNWKGMSH